MAPGESIGESDPPPVGRKTMGLSELQDWIIRDLDARGGKIDGAPTRVGVSADKIEEAIEGLQRRKYVSVIGPPNQNSTVGQDIDELQLLPSGVSYLQSARS
jgi:hypothetical protein